MKTLIQDLDEKIAALVKQKTEIQDACTHPEVARMASTYVQPRDEYGTPEGKSYYRGCCGLCGKAIVEIVEGEEE